MTIREPQQLWSRVFLIGGSDIQQTILAGNLTRNGCQVVLYQNAQEIPQEVLSNPELTPFAILTRNIQINEVKKSPIIQYLLVNSDPTIPLIALKDGHNVGRKIETLEFTDGNSDTISVEHYQVGQLAAPEILKILCETYDKDYATLPIAGRGRG